MDCKFNHKLKDYLNNNLPPTEMQKVEEHIDNCSQCQDTLDSLLAEPFDLKLEREAEVDDDTLVEKIRARKKGIIRITVYGILGFTLGLFSHFYTRDEFIITKAIMALPYKLAEFALGIFFSNNVLPPWSQREIMFGGGMGYFPFHPLLDVLAGIITPAIIASFIAIMVGYLISDIRVFRRKKVINFFIMGLLTFLLWTGILFFVYNSALEKIEDIKGIKEITVYTVEGEGTSWLINLDDKAFQQENYGELVVGLESAGKSDSEGISPEERDLEMLIIFAGGGTTPAYVDLDKGIMQMENRQSYQLAADTIKILNRLMEGKNEKLKN